MGEAWYVLLAAFELVRLSSWGRMCECSFDPGRAWKRVRCAASLLSLGGKYWLRSPVMLVCVCASVSRVRM